MSNFLILTIVFIFLFSGFECLEFSDCGSKVGKFTKVTVSGCDETKAACVLRRSTNASIELDLTVDGRDSIGKINTVVHGIIMGVEMPFPLSNPDGCSNTGLICPIKKGQNYAYVASLPVLKSYPTVKVTVKWELKAEDGADIICVLIPARIE